VLIGELATRTGVSTRLLRYYEDQGLLDVGRQSNGYRWYSECAPEQVIKIRKLLAVGLTTDTIRVVLPCIALADDELVPGCAEMRMHLTRHRIRLAHHIERLTDAQQAIGQLETRVPVQGTTRDFNNDA
jgi:DNA-binding transcriptional MerR regulator